MNINNILDSLEKEKNRYCDCFKVAIFLDNEKNLQFVAINIFKKNRISFSSFNSKLEKTGFLNINDNFGYNVYLSSICVFDKFRSKGIAKNLNNLMEYCVNNNFLNSDEKKMMYGFYEPQQMGEDLKNNIYCSLEELKIRTKNFYKKAGYKLISIDSLIKNPEKYGKLLNNEETLEEIKNCRHFIDDFIIYKEFDFNTNYEYQEIDEYLIHKDVLKLIKKENVFSEISNNILNQKKVNEINKNY